MTKRDRHIRTLNDFGGIHGVTGRQIDSLLLQHGLSILTDEAIAQLRKNVLTSQARTRSLNQQNRGLARSA